VSLKGSSLTFYLKTLDELLDWVVAPASEADVLQNLTAQERRQNFCFLAGALVEQI
jgi:hypothetical protein